MRVVYKAAAIKALAGTQPKRRANIMARIAKYAADPRDASHDVRPLKGRDDYRLRIGDWRVIFMIEGDTMIVTSIAPRGSTY